MAVVKIGELLNAGGGVDPSVLSSYVNYSAIEYNGDSQITGISGSAIAGGGGGGGHTYSGIFPVKVDNTADLVSVSSIPLDVDSTMTSYVQNGVNYFGVNTSLVQVLSSMSAWATANGWTGV